MNIKEILDKYKTDERILALIKAVQSRNARIQLKGLIGSLDAFAATASYFLNHSNMVFILPDREEANYFQADLESLMDKAVLVFPSSYRKPFDFTQTDSANVLMRAEVLNELSHTAEFGNLIVTYPEALAEKVIDRNSLIKNTLSN